MAERRCHTSSLWSFYPSQAVVTPVSSRLHAIFIVVQAMARLRVAAWTTNATNSMSLLHLAPYFLIATLSRAALPYFRSSTIVGVCPAPLYGIIIGVGTRVIALSRWWGTGHRATLVVTANRHRHRVVTVPIVCLSAFAGRHGGSTVLVLASLATA